jgi:cob(I)alamin adenosyltransferase
LRLSVRQGKGEMQGAKQSRAEQSRAASHHMHVVRSVRRRGEMDLVHAKTKCTVITHTTLLRYVRAHTLPFGANAALQRQAKGLSPRSTRY